MNIAKLAAAKQILDAGDVDPSIKRHIIVSPDRDSRFVKQY